MKKDELISKLKSLIEEQQEITIGSPDENLDLDSFTMMLVITFADSELGVKLDMDSLDFDEFKSLNSLANLIQKS
jgi:acyl carrier protein